MYNSGKCFGLYSDMSRLMTKPTKWHVRPAKTQISLGIRPVWSESSLSAWRMLGSLATHWAHSEDSDQTGQMPRLIWVFAGRTIILLVLSWGGSYLGSNKLKSNHCAVKRLQKEINRTEQFSGWVSILHIFIELISTNSVINFATLYQNGL